MFRTVGLVDKHNLLRTPAPFRRPGRVGMRSALYLHERPRTGTRPVSIRWLARAVLARPVFNSPKQLLFRRSHPTCVRRRSVVAVPAMDRPRPPTADVCGPQDRKLTVSRRNSIRTPLVEDKERPGIGALPRPCVVLIIGLLLLAGFGRELSQ